MALPGIKRARKKRGLTQDDLAGMIGLKRAIVSKYESGAVSPSVDVLRKMSEALGVTVDYLLADDEPQAKGPLTAADLTADDKKHLADELEVPEAAIQELFNFLTKQDLDKIAGYLAIIQKMRERYEDS